MLELTGCRQNRYHIKDLKVITKNMPLKKKAATIKAVEKIIAKPTSKHTVLVVEDDQVLLMILASKLRRLGHEVGEVHDGVEATRFVKSAPPCLVFLDILLPKKSGFDFLQDLRSDPKTKSVPVIISSQFGEEDFLERAKKYNVVKYMVKANHSLSEVAKLTDLVLGTCKHKKK